MLARDCVRCQGKNPASDTNTSSGWNAMHVLLPDSTFERLPREVNAWTESGTASVLGRVPRQNAEKWALWWQEIPEGWTTPLCRGMARDEHLERKAGAPPSITLFPLEMPTEPHWRASRQTNLSFPLNCMPSIGLQWGNTTLHSRTSYGLVVEADLSHIIKA